MSKLHHSHNAVTETDSHQALIDTTQKRPTEQPVEADSTPQPNDTPPGWAGLDSYRRNILCLTAQGLTNQQIGNRLCKATSTITNRKTEIIATLNLPKQGWHSLSHYVADHKVFLSRQPFFTD